MRELAFVLWDFPMCPGAILGAGDTRFLSGVFAWWSECVCLGGILCIRMQSGVSGRNLCVTAYTCPL